MTESHDSLNPVSMWDGQIELPELHSAIERLSEREQKAIYLRFWELQTIEEISNTLGLTWEATDKILDDAIAGMRKFLPARPQKKNHANSAA